MNTLIFNTTFATYIATEIIGEGGAGRVYKATDEAGQEWAIKKLDQTKTTQEKLKRFKNEYIFCSQNKHPNIVTVHDHGLLESNKHATPFFVMPLYDGSLRNLMHSGIETGKVLKSFSQILDGIEAAHLQNVVHRDLKPENILYAAASDALVIADFGIARFTQDELYTLVETKPNRRLAN